MVDSNSDFTKLRRNILPGSKGITCLTKKIQKIESYKKHEGSF